MSVHTTPQNSSDKPQKKLNVQDIIQAKGKRKLSMLTAYDYSTAALMDQSGLDMLLIGDSLAMVMLGHQDTNQVNLEAMIHHSRAVVAAAKRSLVVADMPFMTYESGVRDALLNAGRMFREGGVRALKLEGGVKIAPQVKALVDSGMPVCGHIGLTPQRAATLGGFKVQGKNHSVAYQLLQDALALEDAGCFSIVLEAVPAPIAQRITERISVPTIGIGAGPHCDGQVLVYHDMMGLYGNFIPKFAKKFADIGAEMRKVFATYVQEVSDGTFPGPEHCFTITDEELAAFDQLIK